MWRSSASDEVLAAFDSLVSGAAAAGFDPVVAPTLQRQAEILGVDVAATPQEMDLVAPSRVVRGEIFKRGRCLVVVAARETARGGYLVEQTDGTLRREGPKAERSLQVSAIMPSSDEQEVAELLEVIRETLGVTLNPHSFTSTRFNELVNEGRVAARSPSEDDSAAARLLSDKATRSLAISVKASGGLLLSDIAKQLSSNDRSRANDLEAALERHGIIERDVVVICTKTQAQVNRVPDRGVLSALAGQGVKCACGRAIADERSEVAVAITDRGRDLLDGSKWFTIVLLEELERLGVASDRILVEQEAGGDEMDCIADVSGEVVFFELKDKEFSLGNAYSFGAKMGIVRPDHPVIVTTERVGNDAKEHFTRSRSARGSRRRYTTYGSASGDDEPRPVRYIEGVTSLRSGLEQIVGEIYKRDALQIVRDVLPLAAIRPSAVLEAVASSPSTTNRVGNGRRKASR